MAEASCNSIAKFGNVIGVHEEALRLLITISLGYPTAAIYRTLIEQQAKPLQHIFFALCGILLCMFNYGFDTYHSLIAIFVTYLIVRMLYNFPQQLVIINFVFHMAYLLIGYYCTESNEYDILWTMPHCILVLRMIGFGFDVADGRKQQENLSKEQLEAAIEELPSLLELTAFAYFPCSFLIGPQFPYRRYQRFVNGEFRPYTGSVEAGIKRMFIGLFYLAMRQVGVMILPDDYFLTDAYQNHSFIWRIICLGLCGKHSLYKYISCWLLTEGAMICIGISYVGVSADGEHDWSGCRNVDIMLLETGNYMRHYIQSFNINTNRWVAQYVYKRLKFLNNRTISHAATLLFLAVWHGFHSGYYMIFLLEFVVVTVEKQIETFYENDMLPKYGSIFDASLPYKCLKFIALKWYYIIFTGWCFTPLIFFSYTRWIRVYSSVNYFGFVFIFGWLLFYRIYKKDDATQRDNPPTTPPTIDASKED